MNFLFLKPIAETIKKELNIDINSDEYKNTIFSVDSIEIEDPENLPFDKTYRGDIMIIKMIILFITYCTLLKVTKIFLNSPFVKFLLMSLHKTALIPKQIKNRVL